MPRQKNMVIWCETCQQHVTLRSRSDYYLREGYSGGHCVEVVFAMCENCKSPFLMLHSGQRNVYVDWNQSPKILYPHQAHELDQVIPKSIATSYKEAFACFTQGNYTASAIMCRRVVEGLCKEFNAKGRNLNAKL